MSAERSAAFLGEWCCRTESIFFGSLMGVAALDKESRGIIFFVLSACENAILVIKRKMIKNGSLILCENGLINAHIHLIQQLIQFLEGIVVECYLAATFFTMLQFYSCTKMRGEFIF